MNSRKDNLNKACGDTKVMSLNSNSNEHEQLKACPYWSNFVGSSGGVGIVDFCIDTQKKNLCKESCIERKLIGGCSK